MKQQNIQVKDPPLPQSKDQTGGKYLAEGADGCIFEAPGNWPCEKPLKGYSLSDKSLVSKIVPEEDIEGNILTAIKRIASDNPQHYNLIRFVGQCKPKLSGFNKTLKRSYMKHLTQISKTEKACKAFRETLVDQKSTESKSQTRSQTKSKSASSDYKMYVLGKYETTYKEFCQALEYRLYQKNQIADILYASHFAFTETLKNLIDHPVYTVINFDLHSKNIVVFKSPRLNRDLASTGYNPRYFEVGVADFGRAIWCKKKEPYTFDVFMRWDQPYIDSFLVRDSKEDAGNTYSIYNQFPLEARLINYILTNFNRKSNKLWVERMYESEYTQKALKDRDLYDTLLFYLPTFIKYVKGSKEYKRYEDAIEACVRLLADKKPTEQFEALKVHPKIREFWDFLKTRSHLPVAFGVFIMRGLRACRYTRQQIRDILENPEQTKIYVPEKFRLLIFKYINYLVAPFTDTDTETDKV